MPQAKKSRSQRKIPEASLSKAYESELSYETRVVVVILLLLFVYPVGLIFMWAWMRNWPMWLKLIITLPLLLGIIAFFGIAFVIGGILTRSRLDETQQRMHQQEIQLTTSPIPSLPTTITPLPSPTNGSSGTY